MPDVIDVPDLIQPFDKKFVAAVQRMEARTTRVSAWAIVDPLREYSPRAWGKIIFTTSPNAWGGEVVAWLPTNPASKFDAPLRFMARDRTLADAMEGVTVWSPIAQEDRVLVCAGRRWDEVLRGFGYNVVQVL